MRLTILLIIKDINHIEEIAKQLKKLKEKLYVNVDESTGFITLTEQGLSIASSVYERHQIIAKLLISLGVSEETALKDACKIEHDLSEESFTRLKEHYQKYI